MHGVPADCTTGLQAGLIAHVQGLPSQSNIPRGKRWSGSVLLRPNCSQGRLTSGWLFGIASDRSATVAEDGLAEKQGFILLKSAAIQCSGSLVFRAMGGQGFLLPISFAKTAIKNLLLPILGILMLTALGMPAMAEQRGGPNSGGSRPQTPAELRNSDNPCGAKHPCGW